jgi:hypothetical protein
MSAKNAIRVTQVVVVGECPATWLTVKALVVACACFVGVVWLTNR